MNLVADAGKLLRRGKTGGAGTDDCNLLAGFLVGDLGADPAAADRLVGNSLFDSLDGDRAIFEVEGTCFLARGGADAAGELGEIVGRMEVARGFLPIVLINEIVPVRDLVVDGAARIAMAIGDAAIHAARGLVFHFRLGERDRELVMVPDAVRGGLVALFLAIYFKKARYLTHWLSPFILLRWDASGPCANLPFPASPGGIRPA